MRGIVKIIFVLLFSCILNSCEVIKGIFETGVWTGVIVIVIFLAIIIWIVSKLIGGKK